MTKEVYWERLLVAIVEDEPRDAPFLITEGALPNMDPEELWRRASHFRRLARLTADEDAREAALILAGEYEEEAGTQSVGRSGSNRQGRAQESP